MAVREQLYTAADLLELPHDRMRYELVNGHLIEMSPTGKSHGQLTYRIAHLLGSYMDQHDAGQVFGAETGFKLAQNPDSVYGIDVAFVAKARAQHGEDYFDGAPDLAVEVYSPSNTKLEMHQKVEQLFQKGCRLVWLVYPKSRAIYVYQAPDEIKVLRQADTQEGADVLPGFSVAVADIFAVLGDEGE